MPTVCPYPAYNGPVAKSALFRPLAVGRLSLKHRVVLAPLTRLRAPEFVPSAAMAEYYGQRAAAPGTLLISESTSVAAEAIGLENAPGLWADDQAAGWRRVADAVHAKGSFLYVQLFAYGRLADPAFLAARGVELVAPSALPAEPGAPAPRALTTLDIRRYVQHFVAAAVRAVGAGADGVELHAANGYLLDQFLYENGNTRTDEYGGSIENRARLVLEVVDAVTDAIGADRVGVRFSPWSRHGGVACAISPVPQWAYLVAELERRARAGRRLAYIHLVEPRMDYDTPRPDPVDADLNSFITHIWSGPLIRAGNLLDVRHEVANGDDRTLVALGRYFISNPDLVAKLRSGVPLTEYDRGGFYWDPKLDIAAGYTDYPFASDNDSADRLEALAASEAAAAEDAAAT